MESESCSLYIYKLPLSVRQEISALIDEINGWDKLANVMQLTTRDKDLIRIRQRDKSPSQVCLDIWGGKYNHTADELLLILYKLQMPRAMALLQSYVFGRHLRFLEKVLAAYEAKQKLNVMNISNTNNAILGNATANNNNLEQNGTLEHYNTTQNSIDLSRTKVLRDIKPIPEITYSELTRATNNWSEANVLGKGGFGKVYKGDWSNSYVAIKVMDYRHPNGDPHVKVEIQQSLNELKHLISRHHPHIVMLYGYCINGGKPCLVYDLMKGGSLEQLLKSGDPKKLSWSQRYRICRDTAAGINFLHTDRDGKMIIHCDIKPGNILLDECLNAKIGDFGLAREISSTNATKVTKLFGTEAYLPPEYLRNKLLSQTIDIYSFGIVLIETFTNRRTFREKHLLEVVWKLLRSETPFSKRVQEPDGILWKLLQNSNTLFDARIDAPIPGEELDMCCDIMREAFKCTLNKSVDRPQTLEFVIETFDKYIHFRSLPAT